MPGDGLSQSMALVSPETGLMVFTSRAAGEAWAHHEFPPLGAAGP